MKTFKEFLIKETEGTQAGTFYKDFLTHKSVINDTDIDLEFVERLKEYALGRVSANSARVYVGYFKKAFWRAERVGYKFPITYEDTVKALRIQEEASEHVYLTPTELKQIELYEPKKPIEAFTRAAFLLCAYTGCRVSDYPLITPANFYGDELMFTADKRKVSARLPLHPLVPSLVDELEPFNYALSSIAPTVAYTIKQICRTVGLDKPTTLYNSGKRRTLPKWQFVATHTARRSFATNLYLDGYTVKQISSMMGHKNTAMTEGYIITSFADNIVGHKTYLYPGKSANETKIAAIKIQMMKQLGLSEADTEAIIEGIKDKITT